MQKYYTNSGPSVSPVLTRVEEYAYELDAYRLIASTDYTYESYPRKEVLVDYHVEQIYHHMAEGVLYHDHLYHFPIYASSYSGKNPVKKIRVGYHTNGNDTTVVNTSYVSRMSLSDPVRVHSVSTIDGDVERVLSCSYPTASPGSEAWQRELASRHCLSVPVRRNLSYVDRRMPASSGGPIILFKDEVVEYSWFNVDGQPHLMPSGRIEKVLGTESWRESVLSRDCMGNISMFKEKGHPQTVVIWGYSGRYPVALIENSDMEEVVAAIGGQNRIDAITKASVLLPSHVSALASLRTALSGAHITTYTYTPGVGVISKTDSDGMLTSYEYDHAGRLKCTRDNDGNKIEEYDYSLMTDEDKRKHMSSRIFRSEDGTVFSEDILWWDVFGRKTQEISIGASVNGADLVVGYESDFMLHDDVKTWLPYPKHETGGQFQVDAVAMAESFHGNENAYMLKNYELSAQNRVISTALPGYAGAHETSYETDVTDGLSFYVWNDGSVSERGQYNIDEIIVDKVTDADGRSVSTYKDHSGKTIATSNGDDAPTYYIYDLYDRLRAVKSSGIAVTDTLNMWRYDYDSLGRLSSKGIPGSVREFYTYDDEDRLVSVLRDGVLREIEYDAFGRVIKVWQTRPEGQRKVLEEHTYDVYPTGVTGANPKGKKTQSRIAIIAPDSSVEGYMRISWSYDAKGRPVIVRTRHIDGSEQVESLEYTFSGEVASSVITYNHGNQCDELAVDYTYDIRGRLTKETATLTTHGTVPQVAEVAYGYDALGRLANKLSSTPGGKMIHAKSSFALQGWQKDLSVTLDGRLLFNQTLGYDGQESLAAYQPQYSGLVSIKDEVWFPTSGPTVNDREWYTYDYAGRLVNEYSSSKRTAYSYDVRGNLLEAMALNPSSRIVNTYVGDRLMSMRQTSSGSTATSEFTYDNLGRMTSDGQVGQSIIYNNLDLIGKITKNGTTLVNYSYLVDGTKLSALKDSGEGLVYRGPFVYRKSAGPGNSSLTLESAAFGGGRLTPNGAMLYVTDYLGSV